MKRHIKVVHEGHKPYPCTKCQRSFGSKQDLTSHSLSCLNKTVHERKIVGIPSVMCPICNKGFTAERNIKRHIQVVHEGHKPFHCAPCQHNFGSKQELMRHNIIVHERKNNFGSKHELMRHNVIVHERKNNQNPKFLSVFNVQCNFCTNSNVIFTTLMSLREHIKHVHEMNLSEETSLQDSQELKDAEIDIKEEIQDIMIPVQNQTIMQESVSHYP